MATKLSRPSSEYLSSSKQVRLRSPWESCATLECTLRGGPLPPILIARDFEHISSSRPATSGSERAFKGKVARSAQRVHSPTYGLSAGLCPGVRRRASVRKKPTVPDLTAWAWAPGEDPEYLPHSGRKPGHWAARRKRSQGILGRYDSPNSVLSWSSGEVRQRSTFNRGLKESNSQYYRLMRLCRHYLNRPHRTLQSISCTEEY